MVWALLLFFSSLLLLILIHYYIQLLRSSSTVGYNSERDDGCIIDASGNPQPQSKPFIRF